MKNDLHSHNLVELSKTEWTATLNRLDEQTVFFCDDWQALLHKAFGVKAIYLYDDKKQDGTIIHVFKKGPFQVGYAGFPIGGTLKGHPLSSLGIDTLTTLVQKDLQILRINASGFRKPEQLVDKTTTQAETAITQLQKHDVLKIAKVRRDINRSKRFNVQVDSVNSQENHAFNMMHLYKQTLKRNKGATKYNLAYFEGLTLLAQRNPKVHILHASVKQEYAGFLALIIEAKTAYYLHGATDERFKSKGIADLLIYEAIEIAKESGVDIFNMMSSPNSQPSLIKYKEKWGGETQHHQSHEIVIKPFWHSALQVATSCDRFYHKVFRK